MGTVRAEVGVRLRRAREAHPDRLRQVDVAGLLGVDRRTVGNYEAGATEPSYETLYRLARMYGVTVASLFPD